MHRETDTHSVCLPANTERRAWRRWKRACRRQVWERHFLPSGRVVTEVLSPSEQPFPRSTAAERRLRPSPPPLPAPASLRQPVVGLTSKSLTLPVPRGFPSQVLRPVSLAQPPPSGVPRPRPSPHQCLAPYQPLPVDYSGFRFRNTVPKEKGKRTPWCV